MKKDNFFVVFGLLILSLIAGGVLLFMQYKFNHIENKNELASLLHVDINDKIVIKELKADEKHKGTIYIQFQVQKEYFNESEFLFGEYCASPPYDDTADRFYRNIFQDEFDADLGKISYVKTVSYSCDYSDNLLWKTESRLVICAFVEAKESDKDYVNVYLVAMGLRKYLIMSSQY